MKKLILAAALAVGCDDMAYREREAPVAQEGDTYVSDDGGRSYLPRGETSAMRRMHREIEESSRESMRQRRIENDIRNGFVKSGYADIDEAVVASGRLQLVHRSFWGKKRIAEHGEADALWKLQEDDDDKGPSEERMGASDSKSPAWVGKPLGVEVDDREPPRRGSGVSTGKALKRFFLGTGDERL
jgi:hypothetical protein